MAKETQSVVDDDDDIDVLDDIEAAATGSPKDQPRRKPEAKKTEEPAKPQFPARLVRDAEELGLSGEDIEECQNVGELRELIRDERERISFHQRMQPTKQPKPDPQLEEVNPAAKPAAKVEDEEWEFEDKENFELEVHPLVKKEIKRIGTMIKKALRAGDDDRVVKLEKKLDEAVGELARVRSELNPNNKAAGEVMAKYPKLFGPGGVPTTAAEGKNYTKLKNYLFGEDGKGGIQAQGFLSGDPRKDIPKAVRFLFDAEPEGDGEGDQDETPKPAKKSTKAEEWAENGLAAPSARRNGDRPGVRPSAVEGEARAKSRLAENLRRRGIPDPDVDVDDDDDDDF